ncbi:HlyD family efflux transporter periplasmic adaptor subunit [Burkholderiaceae bacterium DAT-1]|nr:HlyD family efflux transporter periplasmic adaptor subunit [Burkholderiaceae bacterium DAT-1]
MPMFPGTVMSRVVSEGVEVSKGDVLFTLSSERMTHAGAAEANALNEIQARTHSLQSDLLNQDRLSNEQRTASAQRLADLQLQRQQMAGEIDTQLRRVESARQQLQKYQELLKSGFMPALQVQQKNDELLDQESRLATLKRNASELGSQINVLQADVRAQPLKDASQRAQLERALASSRQEANEIEARREIVVVAPVDGRVTGIQAQPGQTVSAGQPLAAILPTGSPLRAEFLAPSSAMGFVRVGQRVQMRYAAFPYQKFGQQGGAVVEISRAAVQVLKTPDGLEQAMYRITVQPDAQNITAYGRPEPLQPDMSVEADIQVDRRTLIEWIFEPLIAIKGKL